jgi:hypothetical protein
VFFVALVMPEPDCRCARESQNKGARDAVYPEKNKGALRRSIS